MLEDFVCIMFLKIGSNSVHIGQKLSKDWVQNLVKMYSLKFDMKFRLKPQGVVPNILKKVCLE